MTTVTPEEHCQFFVLRKKRNCRMTVRKGQKFCGEHIDNKAEEDMQRKRVICPHDNKHTCYVHHLKKHLLKCNAQPPKEHEPFIMPGFNSSSDTSGNEVVKLNLADVSDEKLLNIIEKIKQVSKKLPTIRTAILDHPILSEELNKPQNGQAARKHLLQNASLLGNMEKSGLLQENTCYIEFGAGRGQLSYWLADSLKSDEKSMFLLVDRATQRHRYDSRKKDGTPKLKNAVRIRADIKDLCLTKIEKIDRKQRTIAIGKHICGGATDLALTCIANSMKETLDHKLTFNGIMIALCCHHQCKWASYTGKSFLFSHGFTVDDFNVMCSIVSWATCGSGRSRNWVPTLVEGSEEVQMENDRYCRLKLKQEDRKAIGRQCKLVFDFGRLQFLTELGYSGELVYYIDESISPENVCILVTA